MAYAEFGDPLGEPLLSCHGFPGSRLEGRLLHTAALEQGVRVITPDRPGYGESHNRADRKLLDWPADLGRLADCLALEQFSLLGVSGGGPFALACAAKMPERLRAVALVAPLGPIAEAALLDAMHQPARLILTIARQVPLLSRALYRFGLGPIYRHRPEWLISLQRRLSSGPDAQLLANPAVRWELCRIMSEAVRHGSDGLVADLHIYR